MPATADTVPEDRPSPRTVGSMNHGVEPQGCLGRASWRGGWVGSSGRTSAKLAKTPDGNGTLLDHSLLLYGSGMGNPNTHDHSNLPILVAGGAAGGMKGGRHIQYGRQTPLANLHVTLLNKVGVEIETFADSNGKVDELFEPLPL